MGAAIDNSFASERTRAIGSIVEGEMYLDDKNLNTRNEASSDGLLPTDELGLFEEESYNEVRRTEADLDKITFDPEIYNGIYKIPILMVIRIGWEPKNQMDIKAYKININGYEVTENSPNNEIDLTKPGANTGTNPDDPTVKLKINKVCGNLFKGMMVKDGKAVKGTWPGNTESTVRLFTNYKLPSDIDYGGKFASGSRFVLEGNSTGNKSLFEPDQAVYSDYAGDCANIPDEIEIPKAEEPKRVTVKYKINESCDTSTLDSNGLTKGNPPGEIQCANNTMVVVVKIPPLKRPNYIAEIPKANSPNPNPPKGSRTGQICVESDGTAEVLPTATNIYHRFTVNGNTFGTIDTVTAPVSHIAGEGTYTKPRYCGSVPLVPGENNFNVCYETNAKEGGNGARKDKREVKFGDNVKCTIVTINVPPDDPYNPPNAGRTTPRIGCGAFVYKEFYKDTNQTFNISKATSMVPVGKHKNLHGSGTIYDFTGDDKNIQIVHGKDDIDHKKDPPAYAWYDSLRFAPKSKSLKHFRYRPENPISPWSGSPDDLDPYEGRGTDKNDPINLRTYTKGDPGYPAKPCKPGCNSTCNGPKGKPYKNGVTTSVSHTPVYTTCIETYAVAKEMKCTRECWVDSKGRKHDSTGCTENGEVLNCAVWEVEIHYPKMAKLEYNMATRFIKEPVLVTADNFGKLDNKGSIKTGYGFSLLPTKYEVFTDWEHQIGTDPHMIRPEKERAIWDSTKRFSQFTDTGNVEEGRNTHGIDAIGIKMGQVNNAYLGQPVPGYNKGLYNQPANTPYTHEGYNRKVFLGKAGVIAEGKKSMTWKSNTEPPQSQYKSLSASNWTRVTDEMFSDADALMAQGLSGIYTNGAGKHIGKDDWSPNEVYGGSVKPKHIIYLRYPHDVYTVEVWSRIVLSSPYSSNWDAYDCKTADIGVIGNAWEESYVVPSNEDRGRDGEGNQEGTDSFKIDSTYKY